MKRNTKLINNVTKEIKAESKKKPKNFKDTEYEKHVRNYVYYMKTSKGYIEKAEKEAKKAGLAAKDKKDLLKLI